MESLVAINLINGNNLVQKNGVPLLYYWNGEDDVIDSIRNNDKIISWIKENSEILTSVKNYLSSKMAFFHFVERDGEEIYNDNIITFQELITLETLLAKDPESEYAGLVNFIITPALNHLYKLSFNEEFNSKDADYIDIIYKKIKDKYKDRLTKETFINGIRNYYKTEFPIFPSLSETNMTFILSYIEKHIKD